MTMHSQDYTGRDHLHAMEEAHNYNRFLLELVTAALGPADRVVDFGAGMGTFSLPLHKSGVDVVCIEPDETLAAALEAQGLVVHRDARDLADDSVDHLYALNVLEHIEDDAAQFRSWRSKLREGGRVTVYVPAFQVLYSTMDRAVGHFRRYHRGPMVKMATEAGLVVSEARYVDSLGFLAALAFRLLGNKEGDLDPAKVRFYDRVIFPFSRLLDSATGRMFGKNLLLRAHKPAGR